MVPVWSGVIEMLLGYTCKKYFLERRREFAGSKLQFAPTTSASEQTFFCIPADDGIKLQSGGGHYGGCHNVQNMP